MGSISALCALVKYGSTFIKYNKYLIIGIDKECMESGFFAPLKPTLQYALAEKTYWYCCNNAVRLLNEAKS